MGEESLIQQSFNENNVLYPAIPTNHFWDNQFSLPGEGIVGEDCGKTKMIISCSNDSCEFPRELIPHDCKSPTCPICWPRWCKRATNRATEKIWETLELAKKGIDKGFSVSGVVVSCPESMSEMAYDDLQDQFRKTSKKLKAVGIAATLHLWRYRNDNGEMLEAIPWKEYESHPTAFVRVRSPHWHCWTMGRLIDSDMFFEKTGWIYKKFFSESTNSFQLARNDIWNSVYYALSHTAVSISSTRKRHAMRYYGLFWRSKVVEEVIEWEEVKCPFCNESLHVTYLYDKMALGESMNGLTEVLYRRVVTRIWSIRPKRLHSGAR